MSDPVVMARLAAIEARLAALESGGSRTAGGVSSGGAVATDYEMSGQYGDPILKKHPPRWTGPAGEFVGKRFSQCSPDVLDVVAGFNDWKADKEAATAGKEKYAAYSRKDAARARGWAKRLREGWKAPPEPESSFAGDGGGFGDSGGFGDDSSLPEDPMAGDTSFGFGANENEEELPL